MSEKNGATENNGAEPLRVLIIDDEPSHAEVLAESLERVGYHCVVATSRSDRARLLGEDPDVILTDLKMDGVDGLEVVQKAKQELPDSEVVVITGHGDVKTAVAAFKLGAANYLQKPVNLEELRAMVDRAAERLQLTRANRELKRQLDEKFGFEGVIGNSPRMQDVLSKLKMVASTQATVLIHGETGTGKELVARAIHNNSPRKNKNFVAMNCTALNENLLEDELFGHEPGGFTGADRVRKGRFEHASGGTLFLDEIGDMPLTLQAKLLRVIETQEVVRIGSNEPIHVNVRLLSATHQDLEAAVAEGKFRQDLYYRLKVVTLKLPPLRERRQDLPLLCAHFLKEMNQRHGKAVTAISESLRKAIADYDWPGNVRELRNMIESMVVQDLDGVLDEGDLPEEDRAHLLKICNNGPTGPSNLIGRPLSEVERYYIEQTLELTEGNREEAAKRLGIGERTLYRVIQDWKLQDRIREALRLCNGDIKEAARRVEIEPDEFQRKVKKWGIQ